MNTDESGGLSFKSTLDNEEINKAIEETLQRIKGLSSGTVKAGDMMDGAFEELSKTISRHGLNMEGVLSGMADEVSEQFSKIKEVQQINQASVEQLEASYKELAAAMKQAETQGDKAAIDKIKEKQAAIKGEIAVKKNLIDETKEQGQAVEQLLQKIDEQRQKVEQNAEAQVSFRTKLRLAREELINMEQAGLRGTAAYDEMQQKVARLQDAYDDAAAQARILANDQAAFQGIISGLSGIAGGFSAATGAISLFAGENEDLQKVMTKVQSVMAITIGLQQVSQTLNKDSAFQLVTMNKLKKWWNEITIKATATKSAETTATIADTAAKKANTAATQENAIGTLGSSGAQQAQTASAVAGTAANWSLAAAFRAVGLAIKSIPVFGWIAAGISALVAAVGLLTKKTRDARKEREAFTKEMVEGSYKQIGTIEQLSSAYTALGDNMKAKERFIEQNKKKFDELGVSVTSVKDAETLLISNKNAFINAQIAKAKAAAYLALNMENIKKLLEMQAEYESMPDTKTVYYSNGMYGGIGSYEKENKAKVKKQEEIKKLQEKIKAGYENVLKEENNAANALKEAGIKTGNEYGKGSVGALEEAISKKQEALKHLSDTKEIRKRQREIKEMQKQLDAMLGEKEQEKTKGKDAFTESLEKKKKTYEEYAKWQNSTDESIRKSAAANFRETLKEGETYVEYLNNLKKKTTNKDELRKINSAIAEETQKKEAEEERKAKEYLKSLIESYGMYYDKRVKLHAEYLKDEKALTAARDAEQDKEKKAVIEQAIENRKKTYRQELRALGSGDAEYDAMLKEYATFEQKKQRVAEQYAEKRKKAQEKGNTQLIEELNKKEKEELAKLSVDELVSSDTWNKLFSNLDKLTVSEMINLRNKIESEWEKLNLTPEQLNALREKMNAVTTAIEKRNPFAALMDAIKRYKAKEKDVDFKDIARSAAVTADLVKEAFEAVRNGISESGLIDDGITEKLIGDVVGLVGSASTLAMGIASGNPAQIIDGAIGTLTNAFKVFNVQDRKAQRQIIEHGKSLKQLQDAYEDLGKTIDKALGSDRYTAAKNSIENLKKQQKELTAMANAEQSKKKSDKGKINEYEQQIKANKDKIKETIDGIREELMTLDARSAAQELGNAFIDAFSKGEDAAAAFGKKADDIVANIMKKMLIQKLLEQPLGKILDRYSKKWIDDKGNFIGFNVVLGDAEVLGEEMKALAMGFSTAGKAILEKIANISGTEDSSANKSLSGAVKGVSEETAGIVAGQMNAIRINQLEATQMLRNQLLHLSEIAMNTRYNKHLESIDKKLSMQQIDPLRAQGLS